MLITPQPSLDAPSTKPLKVSFPNLEPETKDAYKKSLKKLNGIYTEKLTFDTNVLIATNVDSEKYRIACIIGIPVVTSQWLVDSFAKEQFLPTENYILSIFKGLMIGVLGFNKDETVELEKIITGGGGEIVTSLDRIMNAKDLQLVLMKNSGIKRYESWILSTAHSRPIVTVDWLKDCLVTKQYLKPNKYAINRWRASDRQSALQKLNETITQFQQIDNLLLKIFNTYEIGDDLFEFLEGTVVYFHNLPAQLEKIQKKLVNAGGGVYVKSIIPEVTHIIADEYNEEELKIFHKHRQTKVVDVFWLRDCILYRRLIKADDYLIHPLPKVIAELNNATLPNKTFADSKSRPTLIRRNTTLSSKTNSLETFKTSGRSISSYTEHSTISKNRAGKMGAGKGKEKKTNMTKPIGIFKNINLYFNPEFKELAKSKKLAAENSANILEDLNVFEKIFYILPDSEESVKMFKQNTNSNIKFVSYRWIDYCLKTKMIVRDIVEKKLIYLFPFSRKVPLADFSNAFIYAAGLNPSDKSVLKETIKILGAKFVYDPPKLTVLICEDTTSKKYSDIKNKYPEVPIVNQKWFFDSLNQCEMVNTQSYLV